jgi:hypothetical protein
MGKHEVTIRVEFDLTDAEEAQIMADYPGDVVLHMLTGSAPTVGDAIAWRAAEVADVAWKQADMRPARLHRWADDEVSGVLQAFGHYVTH